MASVFKSHFDSAVTSRTKVIIKTKTSLSYQSWVLHFPMQISSSVYSIHYTPFHEKSQPWRWTSVQNKEMLFLHSFSNWLIVKLWWHMTSTSHALRMQISLQFHAGWMPDADLAYNQSAWIPHKHIRSIVSKFYNLPFFVFLPLSGLLPWWKRLKNCLNIGHCHFTPRWEQQEVQISCDNTCLETDNGAVQEGKVWKWHLLLTAFLGSVGTPRW